MKTKLFLTVFILCFCCISGNAQNMQAISEKSKAILFELETAWEKALFKHDTSVAHKVLDKDFTGVNSSCEIITKAQSIQAVRDDKSKYDVAEITDFNIKFFAPGTAITSGFWHEKGVDEQNQPFEMTYRFLNTWILKNKQWKCISSVAMKKTK